MDLTISIVNWNVKDYLEKCLDSIFRYSSGINLEVIVVDNASQDGSTDMVKQKFPQVFLIKNTTNVGYGCAHNQSIAIAKGRYILFLNPDTEVLPDTLPKIVKFMDRHPEAGASRCRELIKKENITGEAVVLTKSRLLLRLFFRLIHKIFPHNRLIASYYANFISKSIMLSRSIFVKKPLLEGGFLLVRKDALKRVGGFDPKFFLGQEGADLTKRMRRRGWKLYYTPAIKIIHYGLKSINQLSHSELDEMRGNWKKPWQFKKYIYKYWKLQATVILLGFITLPLSLLNPYITKLLIDKAYIQKDLQLFFILALIGGVIFIFNTLVLRLNNYLSERMQQNVHFDMSKDLFRHLENLPLSFFNNTSSGEHIYMLSNDISSFSRFICGVLPQVVNLLPRILLTIAIVFYLNWRLALLSLLLVPIGYLPSLFFARWLKQATLSLIDKSQNVYKRLSESFSHIKLVKALGKERLETQKLEESLRLKVDSELKNIRLLNISEIYNVVLSKAIYGLIAFYGGYLVIKGTITLGSFTAVMIYLTQLLGLVETMKRLYESFAISSVSYERLNNIFKANPEIRDNGNSVTFHICSGKVEFKNVHFAYKTDKPIFQGMNFSVEPCAKIALVGHSGCGKTTLINLILRLFEPIGGSVFIDGKDIKNIEPVFLRMQTGIVLQEAFLWNDSIINNILYGVDKAKDEDVILAANLAEAHDFIMALPENYETVIGEMACKISEGQKQRIAIARALIKKPKILILDEAMSSLDSETEDKILDNILNEFPESTIILVSHRLSTVRKMELVYFLENNSNMVIGAHEELLGQSQEYRELFSSQIEKEIDGTYSGIK
jgi:ABC-type bacteriocin/lantibiotic exporter with double-glycine peptidase domain